MKWSSVGTSSIVHLAAVAAIGCAASEPQVETPEEPTAAKEEAVREAQASPDEASSSKAKDATASKEAQSHELPTECASKGGKGDLCTPPDDFVERLCKRTTPDLALTLFRKGSPWTRAYVRADIEAWYASARRSRPRELRRGEEVIVLEARTGNQGGVKVSGMGSYDVYRFDGTCVSLSPGEVSLQPHGTPDIAPVKWRHLDRSMQKALKEHPPIAFRYDRHREACKGTGGLGAQDNPRCEQSTVLLSRTIANYVRKGGELPDPPFIP